ncbi:MAG: DNA internalization-related competence protein ComEC/Rec2 [Clostridiales bacterium]|jgi:competence protein ComEC|nr:DNA internalization-related competence protein ComEC/Rec2 [Clostridiales bacterium]
MMARPLVWVFIFLAGGIFFGRNFGADSLVAFCAAACVLALIHFRIYKRKIAIILPIFAVLGAVLVSDAISPQSAQLEEVALREGFVRVEGTVEDISLTRAGRQRVRIRAVAVSIAPAHEIVRETMGIMAYLPEGEQAALGQRVVISGYLNVLDGARNPGGFNQFQFLRSRGIEYRLFAESLELHEIIMTPGLHIRSSGLRLSQVFYEVLPERFAGILSAMIVGDRSGLDADTRELYSSVGMFHILIVSGLHVNIMALAFGRALEFLGVKSHKNRGLATIGFIVGFAILTGAGVATMRAAIMGITLILTGMAGFENDTPTSLSLAAVGLLLHQPLFLFDIGFIYSFTMILAFVTITPAVLRLMKPWGMKYRFKQYLAFNIVAAATYSLINSFFFFEFSPYALLANLLIMPSVFITLVLGLLTAIIGLLSATAAQIFAFPAWILLSLYEFVMEMIRLLPFSIVLTGRPQLLTMAIFIAALIAFALIVNRGKNLAKRLGILSIALFASLVALNIFPARYTNISFLDVGQGKSAVISRDNNALVIDGGGVFGREIGENVGVFTLMPYLNYRGILQATAIVTHNSRDHIVGIIEATEAGRIGHIIMARANSEPGRVLYDRLILAAQAANTPITYVATGDTIEFGDMRLDILFPYAERIFRGENNNSMAIRAVYGDISILFTADIEAEAEQYLVAAGHKLSAQVLQVAHQGSRTSTTEEFLRAVNPQTAIISAGRNNIYGHPHPSVTNRLNTHGVEYLTTAERGAVLLRTNGRRITIDTMLGGN